MKLILITLVGLIVGMMVACGGGGLQIANAQEVVDSLNRTGWDVVNCDGQAHAMVGADSGLGCTAGPRGKTGVAIEVYTYAGDAKKGCDDSGWLCRALVDEADSEERTIIFSGNVMLVIHWGNDVWGCEGSACADFGAEVAKVMIEDLHSK